MTKLQTALLAAMLSLAVVSVFRATGERVTVSQNPLPACPPFYDDPNSPPDTAVKSDPTGKAFLTRSHWYIVPPPMPGGDTRNRATFTGIPVTVNSAPPTTSTALVQFGYNADFQCSQNRDNACYAEPATVNLTTPFVFDHETLTGVSCASGCTVTIPALSNRVLYWRLVYRNAGGTVIHRSATNVTTTN